MAVKTPTYVMTQGDVRALVDASPSLRDVVQRVTVTADSGRITDITAQAGEAVSKIAYLDAVQAQILNKASSIIGSLGSNAEELIAKYGADHPGIKPILERAGLYQELAYKVGKTKEQYSETVQTVAVNVVEGYDARARDYLANRTSPITAATQMAAADSQPGENALGGNTHLPQKGATVNPLVKNNGGTRTV